VAFEAGVIDWLPVRGFHHGPVRQGRPEKRPQIRLQSVLLAHHSLARRLTTGRDDELRPTSHLTEESRYRLFDGSPAYLCPVEPRTNRLTSSPLPMARVTDSTPG